MDLEVDKIRHIQKISQETVSLETSVGDNDDDSVLGDFIEDTETVMPHQIGGAQALEVPHRAISSTSSLRASRRFSASVSASKTA